MPVVLPEGSPPRVRGIAIGYIIEFRTLTNSCAWERLLSL